MSLLELPVELQHHIYSYLLCPGIIAIKRRPSFIDAHPFTRQRSGRSPQWTLSPVISSHRSTTKAEQVRRLDLQLWRTGVRCHSELAVATTMCDRLYNNMATQLLHGIHGYSRFLAWQAKQILQHYKDGMPPTVVDCSPQELKNTQRRAVCQRWCACSSSGSIWMPQDTKAILEMAILRVCKGVYAIGRPMVWQENTFDFENRVDLDEFLELLSPWQRANIRRVQIAKKVVVLLGEEYD